MRHCSRSGPAKGYVEALEHRLRVTEGVLLKLLPHVSNAELATTFPDDKDRQGDAGAGYMPLARLEKKGVEEWSQYPLDTAANIRKWQRACTGQGNPESDDCGHEADQSSVNDPPERGIKRKRLRTSHQGQSLRGRLPSSEANTARDGPWHSALSSEASMQTPGEYFRLTELGYRAGLPETRVEPPSASNTGVNEAIRSPRDLRSMQTGCIWDGAPSLSFQQQFLW